MKAPFPWFGGKSGAAAISWSRFGVVRNYVEPFFGTGAVLLARPTPFEGVETVNDRDGLLCNFWRALAAEPTALAELCDWPVNETDLHARHLWLVERREELTRNLEADPAFYDLKLAAWWVWGQCSWIGTGWCSGEGPWMRCEDGSIADSRQLPHLGNAGQGINRKLPHLGDAGQGINRQLPHLGDAGRGIAEWFEKLAARLRRVRVACGDWSRVTGDTITWRHGLTAVFLDPPYAEGSMDYAAGGTGTSLSAEVRDWALNAGRRGDMRIALAGHDGEHDLPGWDAVPWKARGGYGNQGGEAKEDNRHREMLWFSPHCLKAEQGKLFEVTT